MKELLALLFLNSISLGEESYSPYQIQAKWIGNPPATLEAISECELNLGLTLPEDYKAMLQIANGFPTPDWKTVPGFIPVEQVIYYRDFEPNVIEEWSTIKELKETVQCLERAILIAGKEEEQQFLLIPPQGDEPWEYWKFAMWIPGEEKYESLEGYLRTVNKFLELEIRER